MIIRFVLLVCASTVLSLSFGGRGAQAHSVMVELFTSQGCPNCPKANALLADIAKDDDVVALSFAVNYWDYLGWTDTFASQAFTDRQYVYGKMLHNPRVYTPQFVINGKALVKGTHEALVKADIAKDKAVDNGLQISAVLKDGVVDIDISALSKQDKKGLSVWVAAYAPGVQHVAVMGGENKGKRMVQVNMVSKLTKIADLTGTAQHISHPMPKSGGCAIFIQSPQQGRIVAATRIES